MISRTESIAVNLPNGSQAKFEVIPTGGKQDVGFFDQVLSFDNVTSAIEGIAESLKDTLDKAKPQKATVTFGVKVGLEKGQLVALVVNGTSEANLEITLEWGKEEKK